MSIILSQRDIRVALHCTSAVLRAHNLRSAPIPIRDLHSRLSNALNGQPSDEDSVDWLTTAEVAELLGITRRQAQRLIQACGAVRVGHAWIAPKSGVLRFAENYEKGARQPYGPRRVAS